MARSLRLHDDPCVLRVAYSSGHPWNGRRLCGDLFKSAVPRRIGCKKGLAVFYQRRLVDAGGVDIVPARTSVSC